MLLSSNQSHFAYFAMNSIEIYNISIIQIRKKRYIKKIAANRNEFEDEDTRKLAFYV